MSHSHFFYSPEGVVMTAEERIVEEESDDFPHATYWMDGI